MDGLIQQPLLREERDTSRWMIVISMAVIAAAVIAAALLFRDKPKTASGPPPYAAYLKFSDLKMSQTQNFVGTGVTYIDGTLTNNGDKTVTHATVRVTFRDPYGQVAQIEEVPIRALQNVGPYMDAVGLSASPLPPGQNKRFRLNFEHISTQWNQGYPELQIVDVTVK
jgi:hypothetical protein